MILMRLLDDIRHDLVAGDYEDAMAEATRLVSRFSGVSLCRYGSFSPPRSDIDMVAVVPDDYPVERVRALWREILSFVSSTDRHRYLFKQKIKICPVSIWRRFCYVYWSINPASYRLLSGDPVSLPDPPDTPEFHRITLLGRLFYDVQDLLKLGFSSPVSLRGLLSRFYKVDEFSLPLLSRIYGESRYAELKEKVNAQRHLFSGTNGLSEKEREALCVLWRDLVPGLKGVLLDACEDFIPHVIEIHADGAWDARAVERARFFMPVLFKYHRAAYAAVSSDDFLLKRRLLVDKPRHAFSVKNEAYAGLLRVQMKTAFEAEKALFRFGVPSFSMHLAGLWHTADQSLYSRDLAIYWSKRLLGPVRAFIQAGSPYIRKMT